MEEKIERSEELRDRIVKDEKLLRDLSETISRILRGKVKHCMFLSHTPIHGDHRDYLEFRRLH